MHTYIHAYIHTNAHAGFSSFKFVPGLDDHEIVALKTLEFEGEIKTFMTVFNLEGAVLLDATLIGAYACVLL